MAETFAVMGTLLLFMLIPVWIPVVGVVAGAVVDRLGPARAQETRLERAR